MVNPTRPIEIEIWARRVIEQVERGQYTEDARVELKANFPDDEDGWKKWARRVAGHTNAARGDSILWLIGVDEDARAIPGARKCEPAEWWPKVQSCFDENVAPELTDVALSHNGVAVVALHFTANRLPYVVKNPRGGTPEREVPWRDGTSVRSATRVQLLQILMPQTQVPQLEVLRAVASQDHLKRVGFAVMLYLGAAQRIVFPLHKCSVEFSVNAKWVGQASEITFQEDQLPAGGASSELVRVNAREIVADGPGQFWLKGSVYMPHNDAGPFELMIRLGAVGTSTPRAVAVAFRHTAEGQWTFDRKD